MDPVNILENMKGFRSLTTFAGEIGVSVPYLSYVLNRKREPGPKILNYLGLERVRGPVTYRRKRRQS